MPLARLRMELDFMPSPVADRPGVYIRDPFRYSDAQLIVPPGLAQLLGYFDGETPELDVHHALVQATGDIRAGELVTQLSNALDDAGFLDNETFAAIKEARQREFAQAPVRAASHTGAGGYPENPAELRTEFDSYFRAGKIQPDESTIAIAAPHVSPFGGYECYADAYSSIPRSAADKTFVVLGTSHYGRPDTFGLTCKAFETPYGTTQTAIGLVDEIERGGGDAVLMEDYCHAVEHSIEFQVAFLQHLFGASVRVLPILCGSFHNSIQNEHMPEHNEGVRRVFDALNEIRAREANKLFWVLGIDMAHIGRRYGDPAPVQANDARMSEVGQRDKARIAAAERNDAHDFWSQVQHNQDDLNWCGSAPLYTFLKTANGLTGETLRYSQWNIDPESVVSFAALRFRRAP